MTCIEDLLRLSLVGRIPREAFDRCSSVRGITGTETFNQFALLVARNFVDGHMSFSDADRSMNALYCLMIDDFSAAPSGTYSFPQPAFSVYEAFDQGEYDHGDGLDPVDAYTRPAIERLLLGA